MDARWNRALVLAAQQYGLLTRADLRRFGVTARMIDRGCDGLLERVAPGVYRVVGAPVSERTAIAAAALSADGRVSHATASVVMQLDAGLPATPIRVSVARANRHPRIQRVDIETDAQTFHPVSVHRSLFVDEPSVVIDGIRCTDGARTLIDVAGRLSQDALEDAYERARRLRLVSPIALARRFEQLGGRGRAGADRVRRVLANTRPGPLESKLEGKAWRMLRASALPEPVRQFKVPIAGRSHYRIDFSWLDVLVGVEAEGFEWHGSRAQWKADRRRIAALERLGWRILIVTWDDVTARPVEALERISAALAERARLVRPAKANHPNLVRNPSAWVEERTKFGERTR